ncbi:MAG: phosphotransferase [Candidatus Nanopelagicales bacterium]
MELADDALCAALTAWLPGRRWYAAKGHDISATRILSRCRMDGFDHVILGVEPQGQGWHVYQVPVAIRAECSQEHVIATTAEGMLVDAVSDGACVAALLEARDGSPQLDPAATPVRPAAQWRAKAMELTNFRVLDVEQSNTSVVFDDHVLVKVFRRLNPGINPEVEVPGRLATYGCQDVGQVLGWVNGGWRDPDEAHLVHGHLAVIQEFYPGAVDAGILAYKALKQGDDFIERSRELGQVTARVHADLARVLGRTSMSAGHLERRLAERITRAAHAVPEIAPMLTDLLQQVAALSIRGQQVDVQRVHGDLHLGQVLWTAHGWRMCDFEGEPGENLEVRRLPDHPMRDVAGMLRSFAYVAWLAWGDAPAARQWRGRACAAFRDGYESTAGPVDELVLRAYLIDKAAYEAVYEKRNRPQWLSIPLSALAEYAGGE